MLNYIKAELYRNINRAYLWIATGICASVCLLLIILMKVSSSTVSVGLDTLLLLTVGVLTLPIFLTIMFLDIAIAEEHKNLTMKNVLAFGLDRKKLVICKFIVSVILSLISGIIIMVVLFGVGTIVLGTGKSPASTDVDLFFRILWAAPLWIGAVSVGTFLCIFIKNSTTFAFLYAGLFLISPKIFQLLTMFVSKKFEIVYNNLITTQLENLAMKNLPNSVEIHGALIGAAYTVVFIILTIIYFKKVEVK